MCDRFREETAAGIAVIGRSEGSVDWPCYLSQSFRLTKKAADRSEQKKEINTKGLPTLQILTYHPSIQVFVHHVREEERGYRQPGHYGTDDSVRDSCAKPASARALLTDRAPTHQ